MDDFISSSSDVQLAGSWVGTYDGKSVGRVSVRLSFYQLDTEALQQALLGGQQQLEADEETVVGIYQGHSGAIGTISGSLSGATFVGAAQQTTPHCTAVFEMHGTVSADQFVWTFTGSDCLGVEDGSGAVTRV